MRHLDSHRDAVEIITARECDTPSRQLNAYPIHRGLSASTHYSLIMQHEPGSALPYPSIVYKVRSTASITRRENRRGRTTSPERKTAREDTCPGRPARLSSYGLQTDLSYLCPLPCYLMQKATTIILGNKTQPCPEKHVALGSRKKGNTWGCWHH